MEIEIEAKGKPLAYKIKAMSRETTTQKAINVLDADLRNYWSTGTNTKEWILLELQEPCLLSQIRVHNKSVLEWEVAAGLRYKPETFVKVRPRCEAPRRDTIYPMNYTPCRYVRLSCLRGSPIAIFFIQLIGISIPGLEPEFQPVVDYILPQIVAHEHGPTGLRLKLLQDITERLHIFLPQLETELTKYADETESSTRFLAMLAGPFYPILQIVTERETARCSASGLDSEVPRISQPMPPLTVSSNFEPRRIRSMLPFPSPTSRTVAFRPDVIFMLLRRAFADKDLGAVCKVVSRIFHYLADSNEVQEESSISTRGASSLLEEEPEPKLSKCSTHSALSDYSELFGDEFLIPTVDWDASYINVLDIGAVEEGILHVLYASAAEPLLCSKLAGSAGDFWLVLPLIQALSPALRPVCSAVNVDDTFSPWAQPFVQQALSKIASALSSPVYHPLLHGCAGYLSSFSPSHAKTACILIDLCSSTLAPWISRVTAKIDLAVELLEDLLGVVQFERDSLVRVRASLKYLVLALSGYVDEVLAEYKEANIRVLFLIEMLERFLKPALSASQNIISFGEIFCTPSNNQETMCATALQVIRAAVRKPSVLPSLELEWRLGSVPPTVLLSILDPHLELPPEIDDCKSSLSKSDKATSISFPMSHVPFGGSSSKFAGQVDGDGIADAPSKVDVPEDASLLFVPQELRSLTLLDTYYGNDAQYNCSDSKEKNVPFLGKDSRTNLVKDAMSNSGFSMNYSNWHLDHTQLLNFEICERRASEFKRLASDLQSQQNINLDGHNAAVDALILSAECYINPFMVPLKEYPIVGYQVNITDAKSLNDLEIIELRKVLGKGSCKLETISYLEQRRDKVFIQLLLEAAEMDRNYYQKNSDGSYNEHNPYVAGVEENIAFFSEETTASADAITLVRRNQTLLCNFLIHQLRKEQQSLHGTLMQCLLFLLHSATKLECSPETVIDIILDSAEHLNRHLKSIFQQCQEGVLNLSPEKAYRVRRHWTILRSLVIASSGGNGAPNIVPYVGGFQYGALISPSIWISKIPEFSSSAFPLVRYFGWMAISSIGKGYLAQRLFLTSNLSELTHLLSIFADDLATLESVGYFKKEGLDQEVAQGKQDSKVRDKLQYDDSSFVVKYPDLSIFFPNMPKEMKAFRECILEAVAMQLRSVASTAVTDILCWLSDLCLSPFLEKAEKIKGYHAKNAKAIVLYVFEAIICEHMEAVVPELPRLVQVLGSLCRSSYCDVPFLLSILRLLKPIISFSLNKVSIEEKHLIGECCLNFESLCFNELFSYLQQETGNCDVSTKRVNIALVLLILAFIFSDLSVDRKREVIQFSVRWAEFPAFEPTSMFHDYLRSFQLLLESCNDFCVENLRMLGFVPMPQTSGVDLNTLSNRGSKSLSWFPDDFCYGRPSELENKEFDCSPCSHVSHLSSVELEGFSEDIISLVSKLNFSIESSWNLHPQLCKNLVVFSAKCLVYSRFWSSIIHENEKTSMCKSSDEFFTHLKIGFETLAENTMAVQEKCCWEVASTMVDCLLRVPNFCSLDNVMITLTSLIEKIMHNAPKISWRLRTDSWLSHLFSRGVLMHEKGISLVKLISKMLIHPEPEQRFTALMHLGRIFGLDVNGGWVVLTSPPLDRLVSHDSIVSVSESVLSLLVSDTWYPVASMASTDPSLHLRTLAKALLIHYIPFAGRDNLQSFLENANMFFPDLENFGYPMGEGLFVQLSLALIAGVCLYCPAEDLSLVPQNVWRFIETLGGTKFGRFGEMDKRICQALYKIKHGEDDAKIVLKEALSSCPPKEIDPDFGSTRESVLQVLSNLTSVQSYFDVFAEKLDQEATELEEAELEMDILQKEITMRSGARDGGEILASCKATGNGDHRLQQIKDGIRSLEKCRLKEEIFARRQKKLSLRHERQKYLEDAALREAELLQELDRQKTSEIEKDIERQRLLELERSKTNELRHNLDLEKERQTQREIQHELEQVESGSRQPRREFSTSAHSSRPRERYRDRDNGKSTSDGSFRANATSFPPDVPVNTPSLASPHTVVLSGSRSFSGQLPTILQSRDRMDEPGNYDENFDGSKDSGETSSTGDPELASGFDGLPSAFGSSQRHGSRGAKSRQILDRRERDGRREGKWERKH